MRQISLSNTRFRNAAKSVSRRSVAEWVAVILEMPVREGRTVAGFVAWNVLHTSSYQAAKTLWALSVDTGDISPFAPSEYAHVMHKAGFSKKACKMIEEVQERLRTQTERAG